MVELAGAADAGRDDAVDMVALDRLRKGLADLDRFVDEAARAHSCTAAMYHLLMAVRTGRRGRGLDIGMLTADLGVRHPSAAEMVRKAEAAAFVVSSVDPEDRRRVLVDLTDTGTKVLDDLAAAHRDEVRRRRAGFVAALQALG